VFASDGCLALTGYSSHDLIGNRVISYARVIHRMTGREYGPVLRRHWRTRPV